MKEEIKLVDALIKYNPNKRLTANKVRSIHRYILNTSIYCTFLKNIKTRDVARTFLTIRALTDTNGNKNFHVLIGFNI